MVVRRPQYFRELKIATMPGAGLWEDIAEVALRWSQGTPSQPRPREPAPR
jgi:hypothetical protein